MNSFGLSPVKALHWVGLFVILSIVVINYEQGTAPFHSPIAKPTVISFNNILRPNQLTPDAFITY